MSPNSPAHAPFATQSTQNKPGCACQAWHPECQNTLCRCNEAHLRCAHSSARSSLPRLRAAASACCSRSRALRRRATSRSPRASASAATALHSRARVRLQPAAHHAGLPLRQGLQTAGGQDRLARPCTADAAPPMAAGRHWKSFCERPWLQPPYKTDIMLKQSSMQSSWAVLCVVLDMTFLERIVV